MLESGIALSSFVNAKEGLAKVLPESDAPSLKGLSLSPLTLPCLK